MVVKNCLLLKVLVLLTIPFAALGEQPKSANTILLEGPSTSPEALYVQAVLQKIYAKLGYKIEYEKVPLALSFVDANSGRLDGLRARIGNVESDFPNLLKVPFPILTFNMVMIADRRICGACDINSLSPVVVTRGFRAFEEFRVRQQTPLDVIYATRPKQAFEMLIEGRGQGAVMSSTNVPPEYHTLGQYWIKNTLASLPDYHYVHKKNKALIPKLVASLTAMQNSGELARLQKKYGLSDQHNMTESNNFGVITAATASWYQFTDTADATYFKILDLIFNEVGTDVKSQVSNWKRAKQTFYDGDVDMLVGAYAFEKGENGILSDIHIDYELPVTAFAKSRQTLQDTLSADSIGSACFLLGYDFKVALPENVKIHEVPIIDDCIRLVDNGRVDIFLDYEADLLESEISRFAQQEVLEGFPLFVVFQDTKRGRGLKYHFEKNMRELLKAGKMQSLFPNEKHFNSANF